MENKTAHESLKNWLTSGGRSVTWFAKQVGINRSGAHQWLNGKAIPQPIRRAAIEALTGGAVPATSWKGN